MLVNLLTNTKAATNEEYKKVIKQKIKVFIFIMILGIVTFAFAIINELTNIISKDDFMSGVYNGIGSGLIGFSIALIIKNKKLLKDDSALKKSRLYSQDERNIFIQQKAMRCASIIVLVFSYVGMLVAGLYSKAVFYCFWGVTMLFLFSYTIFIVYFNKKL